MERDRSWRRHMQEKHTIRRLNRYVYSVRYFRLFRDVNDNRVFKIRLSDYIGLKTYFMAKSYSTDRFDSKHKVKYSPNKSKDYWRDKNRKGNREFNKREFFKILKEYGIK